MLRKFKLLDKALANRLSQLVFHVFLPALLVEVLIDTDFITLLSPLLLLAVWGSLAVSFIFARILAGFLGVSKDSLYFFASGATWGNVAMIGYALAEALYGADGLARAGILSALLLIMHSALGVGFMSQRLTGSSSLRKMIRVAIQLIQNPIIIACGLGIGLNLLPIPIPAFLMTLLGTLGKASLPLALVSIGASLHFTRDSAGWLEPLGAAVMKLIILPIIAFTMGTFLELEAMWIGSITIAFACPTAISFFVVSRNLGYDASRGATIVTVTAVGSAITVGIIAAILRSMGFV